MYYYIIVCYDSAGKPLEKPEDVSTIRSGNLVQVELDVEIFRMMQEGHGGWNDSMTKVRTLLLSIELVT